MRINWKKRLGVCGLLTLLCVTLMSGALASTASAQVATAELAVTGQFNLTDLQPTDFSFQVTGSAGYDQTFVFDPNGTNILTLATDQTYTVTPVPKAGFTAASHDMPGVTCTNVTLDPAVQSFCLVTFDFIIITTTTLPVSTTTQPLATTTTGQAGQTTVHDSRADLNRCISHLQPELQMDAPIRIGATLESDASPQPHLGDPITLSTTKLTLQIPATLIQAGVDLGLIKNNDQVPSTVTLVVAGTNTTQGSHTYVIPTTAVIKTVKVPKSTKYPLGQKALPLNATLGLADTNWTPTGNTADVLFSEKSLKIESHLFLPGIGAVIATFTCKPDSTAPFIALGATGAPAATGGTGGGTTPTSAGGPGGPGVTPAATTLPRTGSNPWPLLVLAAILIDLGLLAVAGAKRGRRLLHR